MTSTETYDYSEKGDGLLMFAVAMMALAGTWAVIEGIAAIAGSKIYTANATFVFSNLNTWGWIVLLLGVLLLLAAFTVFSGSQFARWFGILAAGVNAPRSALLHPGVPVLVALHVRGRHRRDLRAVGLRRLAPQEPLGRAFAGHRRPRGSTRGPGQPAHCREREVADEHDPEQARPDPKGRRSTRSSASRRGLGRRLPSARVVLP